MRTITILALVCTLQLSFGPSAKADAVTYSAPTKDESGPFRGEIPLKSISSLLLPGGLAQLADDELKVLAVPDWLFDRDVVLRGAIVRAEAAKQQSGSVIRGFLYISMMVSGWRAALHHLEQSI